MRQRVIAALLYDVITFLIITQNGIYFLIFNLILNGYLSQINMTQNKIVQQQQQQQYQKKHPSTDSNSNSNLKNKENKENQQNNSYQHNIDCSNKINKMNLDNEDNEDNEGILASPTNPATQRRLSQKTDDGVNNGISWHKRVVVHRVPRSDASRSMFHAKNKESNHENQCCIVL